VERVRADEETGLGATGHGITTVCRAARSRWRGRKGMTKNDNYRGGDDNYGSGARATRWSEVGVGIDDNYRGGDDNYPRLVVKMGAVGREEGRGRNRQK
jgi:hypothetical protein